MKATHSSAAPAVLTPPKLGEFWPGQGGILGALMRGEAGQPDHYIIVPTNPAGYVESIAWGERGKDIKGANSDRDGLANTLALMKATSPTPAAEWACGLVIDGFNDFYLPARRELHALVANVPELFLNGWYWSSTQFSANNAWYQYFAHGSQNTWTKDYEYRARAVRRLSAIE